MNPHDDLFYFGLKLILRNNNHQVLILKKHKNSETFWELPGGRMQFEETPEQGLRRELLEETGITFINDIHYFGTHLSSYRIKTNFNVSAGLLFSLYSGTTSIDPVTLSADHIDYAWVSEADAIKFLGNAYGPKLDDYIKQTVNFKGS